MIISNNIIVACDAPGLCQFYYIIKDYIHDLNNAFDNKYDDRYILKYLILSSFNKENVFYNKYIISHKGKDILIMNTIDTKNKTDKWERIGFINDKNIDKYIDKCKYKLDIDYFYSVN